MTKTTLSKQDYNLVAFHLLLHISVDAISQNSDKSKEEILELLKFKVKQGLPIVLRHFDERSMDFIQKEFSHIQDLV